MKRCPECDSRFDDTDKFCELDGTPLVADYSDSDPNLLVPSEDWDPQPGVSGGVAPQRSPAGSPAELVGAGEYQYSREARLGGNWKILAMVAVAGVAIGVVLFIVYQRITREAPEQSSNEVSNEAVAQQQMPFPLSRPSPIASASPSPEPSPSPSAMPSPAAQAESPRVALSSSPVSTGGDGKTRRGPVTIRLTNGNSIEAEEVWETGDGIWYRRRGFVTLLQRDQVKAIERPSPASSPSATPATSPSASP